MSEIPGDESLNQNKMEISSGSGMDWVDEKPSNNIQSDAIAETGRLNQLRQEVKTETVKSANKEDLKPDKTKVDNPKVKNINNPVKVLFNKLRYPSTSDSYKVKKKMAMGLAGVVAGAVGIAITTSSGFAEFTALRGFSTGNLAWGSLGLLISSGALMIGPAIMHMRSANIEMNERQPFGRLLTVSKAFVTRGSVLQPVFKKVDPNFKSELTGEMHFVGVKGASWEGIDNPVTTAKEGYLGLHKLAIACEQDDPSLRGINFFSGVSPIVNNSFEKYGFHTFAPQEFLKPLIAGRIMKALSKYPGEDMKYPNGYMPKEGSSRIGIISRENLISHKEDFLREANRAEILEQRRYGNKQNT